MKLKTSHPRSLLHPTPEQKGGVSGTSEVENVTIRTAVMIVSRSASPNVLSPPRGVKALPLLPVRLHRSIEKIESRRGTLRKRNTLMITSPRV